MRWLAHSSQKHMVFPSPKLLLIPYRPPCWGESRPSDHSALPSFTKSRMSSFPFHHQQQLWLEQSRMIGGILCRRTFLSMVYTLEPCLFQRWPTWEFWVFEISHQKSSGHSVRYRAWWNYGLARTRMPIFSNRGSRLFEVNGIQKHSEVTWKWHPSNDFKYKRLFWSWESPVQASSAAVHT